MKFGHFPRAVSAVLGSMASSRCGLATLRAAGGARRVALPTPRHTAALGARLASLARAGDAVLLGGDYGAGKTALCRGFVREWYGAPGELVTSPSYLIDNVYPDDGRAPLEGVAVHHMDLWRLPEGKVGQLVDLPAVFSECVALVEWPERLGAALTPAEHLELRLQIDGGATAAEAAAGAEPEEQPRVATLRAVGARWEARLDELCELGLEGG